MRISKTYLSIVSASLIQGSVFAAPDIEGTFVQMNDEGDLVVNPIFQPEIVNQLHYLIKRSYRITDRQGNAYNYRYPEKLTHQRSNSFGKITSPVPLRRRAGSDGSSPEMQLSCNKWILHEPFTGIHGTESLAGVIGNSPRIPFKVELDYPGFVAYLPREDERPPLIAVVFRGSQSKSFQPLGGILGPSWLTNFSAEKATFPEGISGSELLGEAQATFHAGYLRKYLSARIQIIAHIEGMLHKIPEADRINARIIFTGHSQGAGVALPAALDVTHVLGKKHFGDDFDNRVTPRFFVYALSGPNSTGDSATKELMNEIIGRDNIIRHNSLFDIVTYACPGKHFDSEFCKAIFGTLAGVATGYHPVGHLAIDDMKTLISRGFEYNNKQVSNETLESIFYHLELGYKRAIQRRQAEDGVLQHIRSFYLSVSECSHLLRGAHESDGLYFFACINHYGSSTANLFCSPNSSDSNTNPTKPSHESSFEPRLPETNLDSCLWRGQRNRELIFKQASFNSADQVFSPRLQKSQVITYENGDYLSDSESSKTSDTSDCSDCSDLSDRPTSPACSDISDNTDLSDFSDGTVA